MKIHSLFLAILLIVITIPVMAFDDQDTHPKITKAAIDSSNIENYLIQNIGFKEGLKTLLPANGNDSILEWLKKGSKIEDTDPSPCRASNHFHNPLAATWDQAGLSGYQGPQAYLVDAVCRFTPYIDKHSNVVWATGYLSPSPDGNTTNTNNLMDWRVARNYYRNALTATSKTERETNFAQSFKAIGQVMHLIQDMAVPAHVRNDFHSHLDNLSNIGWSNPAVTGIMMGGLSEYTNANFVSEYTMFKNFTYPSPATSVSVGRAVPANQWWAQPTLPIKETV